MTPRYEIVFSRSARRALSDELPEAVAVAAFDFIFGDLANNPKRVGRPLRAPMDGLYSARRGDYRIICEIHELRIVIEIVSILHRRDADRQS